MRPGGACPACRWSRHSIAALFVQESPAAMGQQPDDESAHRCPTRRIAPALAGERPRSLQNHRRIGRWAKLLNRLRIWLLISTYLGFFMGFFIYIAHGVLASGRSWVMRRGGSEVHLHVLISSLIGQIHSSR